MSDDQDGCEWVNVSSGTYLGSPGQKTVKQCVCVCAHARARARACVRVSEAESASIMCVHFLHVCFAGI